VEVGNFLMAAGGV